MDIPTKDALESITVLDGNTSHTRTDDSLLFLRSFRLQAFKQAKNHREVKRSAIYSSKKAAILHTLPHFFAFLAAVVLIVLNLVVVYVGPLSSTALAAFQFAAKLLELLIVGSIASIILATVRNHLLGSTPFPFGAISAPYRVHDISYLWSLEFWGSLQAVDIPFWTKIIVRVVIPTMIILAALTGPASAVLLIPRIINYPADHNLYLLNGSDVRFPHVVDLVDGAIMYETDLLQIMSENLLQTGAGGWPTSDTQPLREVTAVPDRSGVRYMQVAAYRNASYAKDPMHNLTYVTAFPNKLIGTAAGDRFWSLKGRGYQPYVSQNWFQSPYIDAITVNDTEADHIYFEGKPYLNKLIPYSELFPNSTANGMAVKRYLSLVPDSKGMSAPTWQYISNETNWNQSQALMTFMWRSLPDGVSNHSVVFVSGQSKPPYTSWTIGAETIDARWVNVEAESSEGSSSTQDLRKVVGSSLQSIMITLEPRWLAHLFDLGFQNSSVVGFGQTTEYQEHLTDLSPYISIALSNIPSDSKIDTNTGRTAWQRGKFVLSGYGFSTTQADYDAMEQYIKDSNLTRGYDAVVAPEYNISNPENMAQVAVRFRIHTYGYDATTVPVRLSLAFMMFYALITAFFIIHSLWTSQTSTSWDTVTEIVTLALNSRRPKDMDSTSVAIDTADTCKKTLNVRANKKGSLEMVFCHGNAGAGYDIVVPDEKYD